jgi:hypothetical protein
MAASSEKVIDLSTRRPREVGSATANRQTASMEDERDQLGLQTWCQMIRSRLEMFAKMDHGWDGYEADSISVEVAMFALEAMMRMWRDNLRVPDVSPLSDGSVMFEWNQDGRQVTIEVHGPFSISFLSSDAQAPEGLITTDLSTLTRLAQYLVEGEDPPRRAVSGC